MAQVIIMAKHYRKRPSEILNIDNDLLAYMFDEVALYMEGEAIDSQGKFQWARFKWKSDRTENNSNKDLIDFIQNRK